MVTKIRTMNPNIAPSAHPSANSSTACPGVAQALEWRYLCRAGLLRTKRRICRMTDHTPTPWAVHKTWKAFSISAQCGCGRGEGIASVYGSGNNKTNGEANAEFIVRAVNRDHAFEALANAAEKAIDKVASRPCCSDVTEGDCYCPHGMAKRDLREALALARGGAE